MAAASIAFEAPDNSHSACPSTTRPIDLDHLANQTMGDKSLEAEVLRLFARQARSCLHEIGSGSESRVKAALHLLKGAASSIGAFAVAQAAVACESQPADPAALAAVAAAVVDAENFILKLCR
jgi:HPt (histidine-containing phosphotransfer) domain-containing protein